MQVIDLNLIVMENEYAYLKMVNSYVYNLIRILTWLDAWN